MPAKSYELVVPRPRDYQKSILESAARFKLAACGRRWGKSTTGLVATLIGHGPTMPDGLPMFPGAIHGWPIYWVVPDFPTSGYDRWRDLKSATGRCRVSKSELEHRIVLPGGGSVAVRSANDPDSLRGPGIKGAVLDEAPLMPEIVWTEVLRAALADLHGWAMFLSTPKGRGGKAGWFYRFWLRGIDPDTIVRLKLEHDPRRPGWESWQRPSSQNPDMSRMYLDANGDETNELLDARKDLTALKFAQEYEAEFVVSGGDTIKATWFRYYDVIDGRILSIEGDTPRKVDVKGLARWATVDLATSTKETADYTVISTFCELPTGELVLLDHVRVKLEGPDIVPALVAAWEKHRHSRIMVERVGFQLSIVQDAIRRGLPVLPLETKGDKRARAMHLAARLEAGMLYFPRAASWLGALEEELEDFGGPNVEHDDQVDTLAYACIEQATEASRQLTTR